LWLASIGTTVGTANVAATALRFFFKVTLKRHDLAEEVVSTREPRRLPVVLSQEEVGRLLASAINIKHKAVLSLAYATGLRASEVVSLKLTDIDRDRMVIRVEQGKGKNTHSRSAVAGHPSYSSRASGTITFSDSCRCIASHFAFAYRVAYPVLNQDTDRSRRPGCSPPL
jgi:site-specific recombinase XerD